jgi:hypothetical protein
MRVLHDPNFMSSRLRRTSLEDVTLNDVFDVLEKELVETRGLPTHKRANVTYGDDGLVYRLEFGGYENRPLKIVERPCVPWREQPVVEKLRDVVSQKLGVRFNCCVAQRYPHGRIGIAPHRDKEMYGATIACVNFGATRTLVLRSRWERTETPLRLSLSSGSLYVLHPPTNELYVHICTKSKKTLPWTECESVLRLETYLWTK